MDNSGVVLLSCGLLCVAPLTMFMLGWAIGKGFIRAPYRLVRNDKAVKQASVALKRPGEAEQ